MYKSHKFLSIFAFSFALLPTLVGTASAETLRIGAGNYPPFMSNFDTRDWIGIEPELLAEICARGEFDCVYQELAQNELLSAVRRGEIDLAAGGIGTTLKSEDRVAFTCPYAVYKDALAAVWALDPDIDVESARIAVIRDSVFANVLNEKGLNTLPFRDDREAMAALRRGDADAYSSGGEFARGGNGLFVIDEYVIDQIGAVFGVSESNPELLDKINGILADLSAEGMIGRAQERWLNFNQGDVVAECDESMVIS